MTESELADKCGIDASEWRKITIEPKQRDSFLNQSFGEETLGDYLSSEKRNTVELWFSDKVGNFIVCRVSPKGHCNSLTPIAKLQKRETGYELKEPELLLCISH